MWFWLQFKNYNIKNFASKNLLYKWKSKAHNVIYIHEGDNLDIGVNASAINEGPAEIELTVLDRRGNHEVKAYAHLNVKKSL